MTVDGADRANNEAADTGGPGLLRGRRCVIISNYLAESGAGHTSYLQSLVESMSRAGLQMTVLVVDPWRQGLRAPRNSEFDFEVHQTLRVGSLLLPYRPRQFVRSTAATLYPILPSVIKRPALRLRQAIRRKAQHADWTLYQSLSHRGLSWLRRRITDLDPDIVVVNGHGLGTGFIPDGPKVVAIAHDSLSQRHRTLESEGFSLSPKVFRDDEEFDLLRRADLITAIQTDDAAYFTSLVEVPVVLLLPTISAPTNYQRSVVEGRCLFVGSATKHNAVGLNWFLSTVWPKVLIDVPYAHLRVVGDVCDQVDPTALSNVQLLGRVEDLAVEYAAAQVSVVPLLVGSGLKIKAVEALVYRNAVVATTVGAQGLTGLGIDNVVAVADTPETLAREVVRVLTDRDYRNALERGGATAALLFDSDSHATTLISAIAALFPTGDQR